MKVYYSDDLVTLYHGDCLETMDALVGTEPAHVTVTSPPYNMGVTPGGNGRGMYRASKTSKGRRFHDGYDGTDDAMPQDEYDQWQRDVLATMWKLTADDGAIFYNHKQRIEHGKARLPLGMDFGIPLRQIITWDRGTGIGVNRRHYASVSEFVFLFAKPDFTVRDHSASGRGDVWRLGMAREDYGHPAPFPLSLPATAIETTAARSVFDPFAGTGTTLRAAVDAGIPSVGIEKSEAYCEVIAKRMQARTLDIFGGAA